MIEFDVDVAIRHTDADDDELGSRIWTELCDNRGLPEPVIFQDLEDRTVGVAWVIEARNAREAIDVSLAALCTALGIDPCNVPDEDVVELKAQPFIDPEDNEYVSQAEIARRLDLSRTRVHQLVQRTDFPQPVQPNGRRGALYRWGEVREWNERRREPLNLRSVRGRSKRAIKA